MTFLEVMAIIAFVVALCMGIADEFDLNFPWEKNLNVPLWKNPLIKAIRISGKECICMETTREMFEKFQKDQDGLFTDEDIKPGFIIAEATPEKDIYGYFEVLKILG